MLKTKIPIIGTFVLALLLLSGKMASAQYVTTVQHLSFGSFFPGNSGGTVQISPTGSRTMTGDVIAFGSESFAPAIFEVKTHPNSYNRYIFGPNAILYGSNGGQMTLTVGPADRPNPYRHPSGNRSQIRVGGTLTVGNISANPAGSYSGTFNVIFIEE